MTSFHPSLTLGVQPGLSTSTLNLSTEAIQEATSQSTLTIDSMDSSFHQPHSNQPSPYLCKVCPLCFNMAFNKLKATLKGLPDAEL